MRILALASLVVASAVCADANVHVPLLSAPRDAVCEDEREGRPLLETDAVQQPVESPPVPASAKKLGWGQPIRSVDRPTEAEDRDACPPEIAV